MANVALGAKAVGSIVKLKVGGAAKDFIVAQQGLPSSVYDASCNGTWLLMKDGYEKIQWDSSNYAKYADSTIHTYLNSTFLNLLETDIKNQIKQVKIPYHPGSGSVQSGNNGLSCRIFLLSDREVGFTKGNVNQYIIDDGALLSYFQEGNTPQSTACNIRIGYLNGTAMSWWLRSINVGFGNIWTVFPTGAAGVDRPNNSTAAVRPALILPFNLLVSDDGTVTTNTAPTTPSSITVPSFIQGGSTITVSWGTSTDAQNNLEGYILERSTNGGSTWAQVYQGSGTSTTNSVPFGTESVMYRVKAYDAEGLASGYKASSQVTVVNNTAPTVPGGITVPEAVQGGQPLTISWGASSDGENNLAGYSLERQVDGGSWAAVYSGDQLSFTDSVTKGWLSVAYRVRAFDTANAYSGFASSETRQVNNNTPPAITCEYPGNTPLGVKNEGFGISYSVSDEEGDQVTVTEAVDGAALRTFTAELGAGNSFTLGGLDWMRLLNGRHTLSITAEDGASSTAHSLSFTKEVTKASVTLEQPMGADGPITVCVLAASGFIPADAQFSVKVTNNANDAAPVWEDCTAAVRSGVNHIFGNSTAEEGFAFNFKLSVERGPSGQGGYITSVQGGFQ